MSKRPKTPENPEDGVEFITPASSIADKVRRVEGESPEAMFEKADTAIEGMSVDYPSRLQGDLAEIKAVIEVALAGDERRDAAADRLFALVHNMKGQGTTFGYPLVSQIGALICSILRRGRPADEERLRIVKAHVDALAIVIDHNLAGDGGELGDTLVRRLEGLAASAR